MNTELVRASLLKLPLWGQPGIDCAIRARFRCEYCDRDMLNSLDDYKAWAQDHVVPRKLGGSNALDNMAVSCHPCNSAYKKDWDPRHIAGPNATRAQLIAATRAMIANKRAAEQVVLEEVRHVTEWAPGAP